MLRVLFFIIVVTALGYGFARIADTPGTIIMQVAGYEITVTLMFAAVALAALFVAIMATWWVFRAVLTSPQRVQRFFRARRRDRGYQSLSTGIIAAGAGDSVTARRMLKQADGLLDATTEPLIQLLDAQASLVEGRNEDAREKFEAMLDDPELRNLGLRGLYMEAKRLGDREAARHYAEKAAQLAPQLAWAATAALELKTAAGDWDGAIRLLESQKKAKQLDRDTVKRRRAVLLTAQAMDNLEKDPARAKSAALEAHKLAPDFAPAAVAAAQALFRQNDLRRGSNILETTWRKAPHPEVALAYVNARPGDSAHDRLKRAKRLEQLKPNHVESFMIVGQMAMEAGEFDTARKAVAAVLRNEPREGAFMLMADIEDAETGDQGKVREWLARAVRAPRDPAWTADGYVSETWAPVSPITGRLDAFEWKVPVERLGPVLENDLDPMVPGIAAVAVADAAPDTAAPETVAPEETGPVIEAEPVTDDVETGTGSGAEALAPAGEAETVPAQAEQAAATEKPEDDADDVTVMPSPAAEERAAAAAMAEPPAEAGEPVPPIPDDPGVDPDARPGEPPRRFRLF
ncbi:heme biosynthesis protein HemY [Oricola thermophila]|uniref:Heme biosynthesis protein HemY n=1 Tax=Oricola thermophila TaxID=2742145 RepID=A0A6N1VG40_9HYPH|nr:heme biosynthesis protein HemY [Oricola thermophila]QKV19890.1 heme biosynthesis protein HemY [Oricola thermophila]